MGVDSSFKEAVCQVVGEIPRGRLMTYGQIAAICGQPRAARIVGQVAHWGPPELPWQRVVNRFGGLASGYTFGGREGQRQALEAEGIKVDADFKVKDFETLVWWPEVS